MSYAAALLDGDGASHEFRFDSDRHLYTLDGGRIPGVTTILARTGFGRSFEGANPGKLEMYLERGRWVHRVAQVICSGDFDEEEDWIAEHIGVWRGYVVAIDKFMAAGDYRPLMSETPMCHLVHRYATIPDGVGLWRGRPAVIDFKSSTSTGSSIPEWNECQTTAGRLCLPFLPGYKYANQPHLRLAIEIGLDGNWRPQLLNYPRADRMWYAALSLFHCMGDFKTAPLGAEL